MKEKSTEEHDSSGEEQMFLYKLRQIATAVNQGAYLHHIADHYIENQIVLHWNRIIRMFTVLF
jgi:hypothetical protein